MRNRIWMLSVVAVALAAGLIGRTMAADAKKAAAPKNTYVIASTHTGAECLKALDGMEKQSLLDKTYWGCKTGDHRGWTTLQADSKEAAVAMLPESERASAEAVQVSKFTSQELKNIHAQHG